MEKWTCKCGTVNDTRFCTSCGTPKEQAINASVKQEIMQNAAPKEKTSISNYANAARSNKKLAGVIILAVLLFVAYFGYNKWVDYIAMTANAMNTLR